MAKTKITLIECLVLMLLVAFSVGATVVLKLGTPVIGLMICWVWIYVYCLIRKIKFKDVLNEAFKSISIVLPTICLLVVIGIMIGSWILCGTIPSVICWGLNLFDPNWILPIAVVLCAVFSLITGTSYGSVGSIGVAFVAIGASMGVNPGMLAGAVICGAMFGDKLSPLSDTTNLAAGVSGAKLGKHVRSMLWNTIPTLIITVIIFIILGFSFGVASDANSVDMNSNIDLLKGEFQTIGLVTIIPMLVLMLLLILRVNSIISILISSLVAGIIAMVFQDASILDVVNSMISGYKSTADLDVFNSILNSGGMISMFNYIAIIIFAVGLGGMLNKLGVISRIVDLFKKLVINDGTLVICTLISGYLTSIICCSQPLSHVLTAQIMKPLYKKRKVAPEILSRSIEDSGTLSGPLIPWHGYCLFMVATLGVAWIDFAPYLFLIYLTPLFSIFYGFSGISIKHLD